MFDSFERVLGEPLYSLNWPDWRATQEKEVRTTCANEDTDVSVATVDGQVAAFVASHIDSESDPLAGEIEMIAVDPEHQRRGVATVLLEHAIKKLRDARVQVVSIGTGGDPGHAPARGLYEKAGFRPLPIVRYYRRP